MQIFASVLGKMDPMDIPVVIPSGETVRCSRRYLDVPIVSEGVEFKAN